MELHLAQLKASAQTWGYACVGETGSGEEVIAITTYKPGNIVPVSGQYGVVDVFGIYLGVERTCVKGEPFPPITTPGGVGYVLRDATQH